MDKVFIDSTIWVEFFKGHDEKYQELLDPLIENDRIYYNGIIMSELLTGSLTHKEFDFLAGSFDGFHYLESNQKIFRQAGELGFKLRRKGLTVPLSDLIIAAHCIAEELELVSLDKHFKMISEHFPLKLMEL